MHHNPATSTIRATTRPRAAGRRMRLLAPVAAAVMACGVAGAAGAVEPTPTPEPQVPIPSPAVCLALTRVNHLTATGGPFAGGTKITWNVNVNATPACSVTLRLRGEVVPASGSRIVDPDKGDEYPLTASMGGLSKQLGTQVVLGGDVFRYARGRGGLIPVKDSTTPQPTEARRIAAQITTPLSTAAKRRLLGKRIEVHLIPASTPLTALPPWRYLSGRSTCGDVEPVESPAPGDECPSTPWAEKRGAGDSKDVGADRVVVAAGEETLLNNPARRYGPGYVLAHELGHLVLTHAAPAESVGVESARHALRERERLGEQFVDTISRNSYNAHEYFADGTAALFGYRFSDASTPYTPDALSRRHPELLNIVRRVYPGVG